MKKIHVYLISDSTGETVSNISKSSFAHFKDIIVEEHLWALFRNEAQLNDLRNEIKKKPGIVMYTVVNSNLIEGIREICRENKVPCIAVLEKVVNDLKTYLDIETISQPGRQHELNDKYFSKIEAINYSLLHDDGQSTWDLNDADIILVGPSRTSKSPTCMYLSYRGFKSANIPYVQGCALPESLFEVKKPLIIGLTIDQESLIQIRKNRLISIDNKDNNSYINEENVFEEIRQSRKLFLSKNWPIIDVTRSSVEETAAKIIQIYEKRIKNA